MFFVAPPSGWPGIRQAGAGRDPGGERMTRFVRPVVKFEGAASAKAGIFPMEGCFLRALRVLRG